MRPTATSRAPRPRRAGLLLACAPLLLAGSPPAPARGAPPPSAAEAGPPRRALWVWGEASAAGLLRQVRTSGTTDLFLELPASEIDARRRRLARRLRQAGLRVWAMSGHAGWAERPSAARTWARGAARAGVFDGAVLDIEPYLLEAWRQEGSRARLIRGYLRALRGARANLGAGPLLTAVPFWFDHERYRYRGESLTAAVLDRSDGLVIMAYRDHATGPDGILALTEEELALARRADKRVWIGVQTAADALDKLTFHEEGRAALERELSLLVRLLGVRREFAGVAVHHFTAYRRLRP